MASALAGSRINHATASTVELVKKKSPARLNLRHHWPITLLGAVNVESSIYPLMRAKPHQCGDSLRGMKNGSQ
ncbi:MAG TPA: hypothetical protein PKO17_11050, partial [Pseudomonadales bacterium]|nr:hypothetical protein [Pseudomonadales bacterium]